MRKQLQGAISEEELLQLQQFVQDPHNRESVAGALALLLEQQQPDQYYDGERFDPLLREVLKADKPATKVVPLRRRLYRWVAAAAILVVAASTIWFFVNKEKEKIPASTEVAGKNTHDAEPGKDGAVLTLADGTRIVLDSMQNGVVEKQGIKAVVKNGELVYQTATGEQPVTAYNTMSTPRGRQFKLVLPDGTKVWLNAASSITYPVRFAAQARQVEIAGEVYFEVAKDPTKPFKVKVSDVMQVEVLGTHFNINAHDDGAGVATTLLEGAIRLSGAKGEVTLKPGEQFVDHEGKVMLKKGVDVAAITAWKDGLFHFSNTSFPLVMGQLKRWYDIEVEYENGIVPPGSLSGEFPRSLLLSEVLHILEYSGLKYKIENKKLVISAT